MIKSFTYKEANEVDRRLHLSSIIFLIYCCTVSSGTFLTAVDNIQYIYIFCDQFKNLTLVRDFGLIPHNLDSLFTSIHCNYLVLMRYTDKPHIQGNVY